MSRLLHFIRRKASRCRISAFFLSHDFPLCRLTAASVCVYEDLRLFIVCFCLAGEPAEKDLPARGAAPQRDAAEG